MRVSAFTRVKHVDEGIISIEKTSGPCESKLLAHSFRYQNDKTDDKRKGSYHSCLY